MNAAMPTSTEITIIIREVSPYFSNKIPGVRNSKNFSVKYPTKTDCIAVAKRLKAKAQVK